MIKIWCEECNGSKQVQLVSAKTFGAGYEIVNCGACDGKGYTEHEGTLEELELAQAVKLVFEEELIITGKLTKTRFLSFKGLINWYKEQKGGK